MDKNSLQMNTQRLVEILSLTMDDHDPDAAAVAFSGGLDSSILAYLFSRKSRIGLYTAAVEGSPEAEWAPKAARSLHIGHTSIHLKPEDIISVVPEVCELVGTVNPVVVSYSIPLYFVARLCDCTDIVTGQGADELFGGYARYLKMTRPELEASMAADIEEVLEVGRRREIAICHRFGRIAHHPFMDPRVIGIARGIPLDQKVGDGIRKRVLREAAAALGLPRSLVEREKKAAQYGSGSMKVLHAEAKRRGLRTEALIMTLCEEAGGS